MNVLDRLKDTEKDVHEIEVKDEEFKEEKGTYIQRQLKKLLNKGDIFGAIYKIEIYKRIPPYFICNESNVDYRKYKRAFYYNDTLSDQEIQRLTNWIEEYYGLNL